MPSGDLLANAAGTKIIFGPWNTTSATSPTGSEVLSLSLAVNSDVSSFTDGTWSVKDPTTGNVYVGLGVDTPVNATTNNYTIQLIYSNTQGATFSNPQTVSAENTAGYPSLTVEQGGTGSGVNTPGQVEVVWDNFATVTGIPAAQGSLGIETRGFIPTQNLPTPGATPPAGTFVSAEVAAFTSIPTIRRQQLRGLCSGQWDAGCRWFQCPQLPGHLPTSDARLADHRNRPLARGCLGQHPGGLQPVPGDALRRLRRSFPVHREYRQPQRESRHQHEHLPDHLEQRRLDLVIPRPGQPGQRGDGRVLRRKFVKQRQRGAGQR